MSLIINYLVKNLKKSVKKFGGVTKTAYFCIINDTKTVKIMFEKFQKPRPKPFYRYKNEKFKYLSSARFARNNDDDDREDILKVDRFGYILNRY